jgi:predicted enzyme related to lactoylglutathione lyase
MAPAMTRACLAAVSLFTSLAFVACGSAGPVPATPADEGRVPGEVTIGVPVPDLSEARAWYATLIGREVETIEPVEGVVELRVAEGAWLQLFVPEGEHAPSPTVLRLATSDIDAEDRRLRAAGIELGEIVRVPGVVAFAELADPFGNRVGLYQVLAAAE